MRSDASIKQYQLDELVRRAVELAFGPLRIERAISADSVERIIDLLDAGALDTALNRQSPPVSLGRPRQRFLDSVEFSNEEWKRRHGIQD